MPRAQTPPSRPSKSAAVRQALERPSARQLSKWKRERRQRRLIWATAVAVPLLIALHRVRINSSPGAGDRSCCALISPWPGSCHCAS